MQMPKWFGVKYPTLDNMTAFAEQLGAGVADADIPFGLFFPDVEGVPVILLPKDSGPLQRMWYLAHEVGHLLLHRGYASQWACDRQESRADRWAARALIPESAVRRHQNASVDAFIGALSAHYEDIPLVDCPQRRLAGMIAIIRIGAVEEVG